MKVDDAFHGISTMVISVAPGVQNQGTGFFYQQLGPKDPSKGQAPQWLAIEKVWLVTNRHVLLTRIGTKEIVPDSFSFHLRKVVGNKVTWEPIMLNRDELLKRARFHVNEDVDVCTVYLMDLLTQKIESGGNYLQWYGMSTDDLPGKNKISPEVGDDAVVIGYPRGFYDQFNLYPIVKSGIIASMWGANFNGYPYFLIDAKLFPGSSGSIVVSKPTHTIFADGKSFFAKEKQFTFLGIFSGEPIKQHEPLELDDMTIIRKSGFNLGIVWYGHLVDEIIAADKPCNLPMT